MDGTDAPVSEEHDLKESKTEKEAENHQIKELKTGPLVKKLKDYKKSPMKKWKC